MAPSTATAVVSEVSGPGSSDGGVVALSIMLIALLGIGAQWLAWRLRLPSILLLLGFGFLAGPGSAMIPGLGGPWLRPDGVFGGLLLPLVSVCVALILYEGGLTLRFREIRGAPARVVALLVSVGALVTWVLSSLGAVWVLGLQTPLAVLFGAVLIVTGPTVIGPLLSHIRPSGHVGPVLRWEGIVIDPIGALAAVLVYEAILIGSPAGALGELALAIVRTLVIGAGMGTLTAVLLIAVMERFWVPESLQNSVSLMLVVIAATLSNALSDESGLLTATVMGVVMANQRRVDTGHILEFKENLRVLIIGGLFVVLAGRVSAQDLAGLDAGSVIGFIALLIGVIRPAGVFASTIGSGMCLRERLMLCCMAPRGIVAAAVSSTFALALEGAAASGVIELESPGRLTALTFAVIVGTVVVYGLLSPVAARWLGVADQNPMGLVIVGASPLARAIAAAVAKRRVRVLLVDTNRGNVTAARMLKLDAQYGNVLEDATLQGLDLRGIGRAMALTPNAEVNTLALQRFERLLGKANVYRIPVRIKKPQKVTEAEASRAGSASADDERGRVLAQHGRRLFDKEIDLATLEGRLAGGWILKSTTLSEAFPLASYRTLYGPGQLTLFVHRRDGTLAIQTAERPVTPEIGDSVIALVDPDQLLMPAPAFDPAATNGDAGPGGEAA